jgi:cyclic pyranopterin phosphate synthase
MRRALGGLVAEHARRRVASTTASWLRWSSGVPTGGSDSTTSEQGIADGRGRQGVNHHRSPSHRANSPVRYAQTAASMPEYEKPPWGGEEKGSDAAPPGERVKALRRRLRDEAITDRSGPLEDTFGRHHNYLRISLTEKCNLRCLYCMPEEGIDLTAKDELLSADEVVRVARLFVANGVDKIRLTGGEPTVRPDLEDIIRRLRALPGLNDIAITTNGLTLHRNLESLQAAGLTHVNISLDTLVPPKFELLTRRRGHDRVLKSIDRAVELGYDPVKVNVVLMRGVNDDELLDFVEMTRTKPVNVRFIEFMPFDGNKFEERKVVSYFEAKERILGRYPSLTRMRDHRSEVAKNYKVDGHEGMVSFVTSMTNHFCGGCNRLRIMADGNLKVCLFDQGEVSLRDAMRGGASDDELMDVVGKAVGNKKAKHAGMSDLQNMENRSMIKIGG